MLERFWFTFDAVSPGDALNLGCGVTAYGESDARRIVNELVFAQFSVRHVKSFIRNVDIQSLDGRHVRSNMGNPASYGVWFPLGVTTT